MKRPLIADRLCRQTTSESERAPSQPQGESTPFELEKSGLSNEYDFYCAELPASTNDTIGVTHAPSFNFNPFGIGLAEFICLVSDFDAASTAVTTIQNENEIERKYEGGQDGPHSHTQTRIQISHLTTPVIESNDKVGTTGIGSREINNVRCVFGGIVCENEFYYHVKDIFDEYFYQNFYDNYILSITC